jgi:hypothetical protein
MGDADGLDERIFATLNLVLNYGGDKWWLYISKCHVCGQNWMVAQEERIHDNYFLKRIESDAVQAITEQSNWPNDFLLYEQILRLGRDAGKVATFLDPLSPALVQTAQELLTARPDISLDEIAYVLAIPIKQAAKILPA